MRTERNLQAVVLCDSYLPRFSPLTEDRPRCLLPLANMPLIEYTLEFLVNCGVSEVYLMCGAHASQVTAYIQSSKWVSSFIPFRIHTIELPNAMSVGDAMRDIDARGIITSDFLLISGDVVCNIDFEKVWQAHVERKAQDKNCIMSMVLRQASALHRTRSNRTGLFVVDQSTDRLVAYHKSVLQPDVRVESAELLKLTEVAFRNDLIDCRVDICTMDVPALFTENFDYEYLRDDFVTGVLTSDLLGKTIYTHIIDDGYAARVESLKTYKAVTKDIVSRYAYPLVVDSNELQGQSYRYQRGHIYKEKDVVLSQSCTIGLETVVGGKTSVGERTDIQGSVLGRRCKIGDNVKISESYIWEDVVVEEGATITGAIVGNGVLIGAGAYIGPGSVIGFDYRVEPDAEITRGSRLSQRRRSSVASRHSLEARDSEDEYESAVQSDSDGDSQLDGVSDNEDLAALVEEMYLSDDSISSIEEEINRKSGHHSGRRGSSSSGQARKSHRKKGRSLSTTSNYSHDGESGDDINDEFLSEAIASINRSIVDKHSQDVAILELNTLRMTMNAAHEKVQEAAICALVRHIGHLITQTDIKTVTSNVFRTWSPLLKRITFDQVGQVHLASLIEANTVPMIQGERVLAYALMTLYDTDVISEDAIYAWWKTPEQGPKVRTLAKQWVEWLETAEEESD